MTVSGWLAKAAAVGLLSLAVVGLAYFGFAEWAEDDESAKRSSEEPTASPTVSEVQRDGDQLDSRDQAMETEFAKPRFSGVVNGIQVSLGAQVEIPPEICSPGNSSNVPIEQADGSAVDFTTNYLPEGAELANTWAVECQGNYILTFSEWSLTVPDIGAATLLVTRFVSSNRPFDFDSSADRVEPGEINGKPAVLIDAVIPEEGYGPAGIAISEDFGVTLVTSINLTLEELERVAEALA